MYIYVLCISILNFVLSGSEKVLQSFTFNLFICVDTLYTRNLLFVKIHIVWNKYGNVCGNVCP